MKNIVVCCDGTANEFATDKTNVIKLFSALQQEPTTQMFSITWHWHDGAAGSLYP